MENVTAFAKPYGYIRYFHPSDKAAEVNWNQFVIGNVRRVEGANNPSELARKLEAIFRPIAPTVRVYLAGHRARLPRGLLTSRAGQHNVTFWSHFKYGRGDISNIYKSNRLIQQVDPNHDTRKPVFTELGGVCRR